MHVWIACIKRLNVSEMTWLSVQDDLDIWLVRDNVDDLHVEIELIVGISFIRYIDIDIDIDIDGVWFLCHWYNTGEVLMSSV